MAKAPTEPVKEIDVDINEATHAQLLHFAQHQNLAYDEAWSKSQLLAQIKKAWAYPTINVPPEVAPVPAHIPQALAGEGQEKIRMIFHTADDDQEGVVEGSVNGHPWRMQRGVEVEVSPEIYYGSIQNAVRIVRDPRREGGLSEPRYVHTYPHTILPPKVPPS